MVKDLFSFSECGQYFVHGSSDGKLQVWDTFAGNLKQEYAPNLHLNSPCTCIAWIPLSGKMILQNQKRKRKLKGKLTNVIALGTDEGSIALYSLSESGIVSTFRDESSKSVKGLSWSKNAGLFSVNGTYVTQWDLESKSVIKKWKCKGNASSVAVSPNGKMCATGNININLWDVDTMGCVKTLMGHSSLLNNLIFINENYFLSCGISERHILAWSTNGEEDTPVGKFSLGDNVRGEISIHLENTSLHMVAATNSGALLYFNQQLNGKVTKLIKPTQTIHVVNNTASTNLLPVVGAQLRTTSTISAVYGRAPFFGFETFSISLDQDGQIINVHNPPEKRLKVSSLKCSGDNGLPEDAEYINRTSSSTSGLKRKLMANNKEVTMEERLGNLCIDLKDTPGIAASSTQNPHNLSHLLLQGLDSKDKSILESVLLRRDPEVIYETVIRLPVHALKPLVQELNEMMQGRSSKTTVATDWLKAVLREHSSQLLADPSIQICLSSVQSLVETRLGLFGSLGALSGRLGHILQQLDADSQSWRKHADNLEPLVLYQEKDSSGDEDGSIAGDESEDKWDELSDQIDSEASS